MIDDDAEYFKPYYEVGALDRREKIGEYKSLALVQVKNYKPATEEFVIDQREVERLKKENVSN